MWLQDNNAVNELRHLIMASEVAGKPSRIPFSTYTCHCMLIMVLILHKYHSIHAPNEMQTRLIRILSLRNSVRSLLDEDENQVGQDQDLTRRIGGEQTSIVCVYFG